MRAWFRTYLLLTPAVLISGTATPTMADPAVIEGARAVKNGGDWTVSVTLRHGDTGWEDYADGWRVIGPEGEVLGTRELAHPHETEQPFTRSLSGVTIPEDIAVVEIEARTSTGGWEGARFPLTLPR
ncbi:hypothetical protein [Tropicimonas isoalkanivorans]|uniref:Uncharacterized protein n=1 Tax=Tropicimonas isoalkanivorans TaxID=441112 RepID=A0A1I1PRH9_9RHOB|nr:hypothetical protein [Tropicimonas isoalkanivorans]SFD12446.1 hypothetical protein SAMN04488094_11611 [Tropicimonas isoalkanivorans]